MLASSLSMVDPLLSSPEKATRHNDDMASLQLLLLPPLELPASAFASLDGRSTASTATSTGTTSAPPSTWTNDSSSSRGGITDATTKDIDDDQDDDGCNDTTINETNNNNNNNNENDNNENDNDEEDAETPLHQLMNRGNYLRQLRLLALADEEERMSSSQRQRQRQRQRQQQRDILLSNPNCHSANSAEEKKEDKEEEEEEEEELLQDKITLHPTTNDKILDYNSYLAHQRYYDDLKHVDVRYINFGTIPSSSSNNKSNEAEEEEEDCHHCCCSRGQLIIEQQKSLGKGGFCWDAGFCLGEFVIGREKEWNHSAAADCDFENNHIATRSGGSRSSSRSSSSSNSKERKRTTTTVLELGAGTGLCGLMVAKATNSHVILTDLPELLELMQSNVDRNFGNHHDDNHPSCSSCSCSCSSSPSSSTSTSKTNAKGTASAQTLRWGTPQDYNGAPYDVIIGADIVASLYDPVALAQTLYDLSGPHTKIYISSRRRLDEPHVVFEEEIRRLFGKVAKFRNVDDDDDDGVGRSVSRLRNPNVFFTVLEGKLL